MRPRTRRRGCRRRKRWWSSPTAPTAWASASCCSREGAYVHPYPNPISGAWDVHKGNSPEVWCAVFIFYTQRALPELNLRAACAKKSIDSWLLIMVTTNDCQFWCLVGLAAFFTGFHPDVSSFKLKTSLQQRYFSGCGGSCLPHGLWAENGVCTEA